MKCSVLFIVGLYYVSKSFFFNEFNYGKFNFDDVIKQSQDSGLGTLLGIVELIQGRSPNRLPQRASRMARRT